MWDELSENCFGLDVSDGLWLMVVFPCRYTSCLTAIDIFKSCLIRLNKITGKRNDTV